MTPKTLSPSHSGQWTHFIHSYPGVIKLNKSLTGFFLIRNVKKHMGKITLNRKKFFLLLLCGCLNSHFSKKNTPAGLPVRFGLEEETMGEMERKEIKEKVCSC